ncbi:hypothetical protein CVIRNUC_007480 [Coccomyxa viridis]|uniref:cyclin-dependent kinase n=1 Tax=Coccomyxa viridis TaxID=1274662 RepID=A0AAV1IA80_9CHLO|nr:hypothetical protein CVIRNUC_007480 [Coccomyxa viridis]
MGPEEWDDPFFPGVIGSYRITGQIGSGTFGEVQQAVHCVTGKTVALKQVYLKQPVRGPAGLSNPAQNVQREIAALRALKHPNVVTLLDVIPRGDSHVLVMELCSTDLAAALEHAKWRWDRPLIRALLQQLLQGIAACHQAGYLHRDLKPANLLLTAEGALKVGDLGLARPHDAPAGGRAAAYTCTVATRWYRAPELLLGSRRYGPAADMWAVGCIFAEMLGMCPLFPGESDFDQLGRVVEILGSIRLPDWPEAEHMPDFRKLCFMETPATDLKELYPDASAQEVDLLTHLIQWNPGDRLTAEQALQHEYLSAVSQVKALEDCKQLVAWTVSAQAAGKQNKPWAQ